MSKRSGFTVVELIVVIVVLVVAGLLFWSQKSQADAAARDKQRKTDINAIAYALNRVYYKKHGYYPQTISPDTFKLVDPALLKDPYGRPVGARNSDYRYQAKDCQNNKCQGFTLRALLELESDYIKSSTAKLQY